MSGDSKLSGPQKRNRSSLKRSEKVVSDDSPPKKADSPTYENVFGVAWSKAPSVDAKHENKLVRKGSSYENISNVGKDGRPLTSHHSEPSINVPNGNGYSDVIVQPKKPRAETSVPDPSSAQARLLHANISTIGECQRCEELEQLLAMWELGVSGFARNYSMILAQLNKVRDASICLESKMKQRVGIESSIQNRTAKTSSLSASNSPSLKVRHSMLDNGLQFGTGEPKLADHMYPPEKKEVLQALPSDYAKYLGELNTHLGKAMELCQKLAAACFKKNQSVLHQRSHAGSKKRLTRLNSQPDPCTTKSITPPTTPYRPSLVSISENNLSGTLERKRESQRRPGAPVTSRWEGTEPTPAPSNAENQKGLDLNGKTPVTTSTAAQNAVEKQTQSDPSSKPVGPSSGPNSESSNFEEPSPKPYHSHMMSLIEADEQRRSVAPSFVLLDSPELRKASEGENEGASNRDSVLSSSSAFSDNDVKQVMSKIADLEEERIKLLETIDGLHQDNQHVRTKCHSYQIEVLAGSYLVLQHTDCVCLPNPSPSLIPSPSSQLLSLAVLEGLVHSLP